MKVDAWGELAWLWARLPQPPDVRFLGALSAEERCIAVFSQAPRMTRAILINVEDPPSPYTARIQEKIRGHRQQLDQLNSEFVVESTSLFSTDEEIANLLDKSLEGGDNVALWLDISSLPKRFFFLLAKLALDSSRVDTLVVTYTQPGPAGYSREPLAEDPDDVRPLPGFAPGAESSILCVAVGFESLGLPRFIGEYRDRRREVFVIVPFPPGQPYSERIWRSVQRLNLSSAATIRRVSATEAYSTFHLLCELVPPDPKRPVALAPYGPKPISLGMAMYAMKSSSPVFYTQPRVYHPDYTVGVGRSWGYCLKLNGLSRL